MMVANSFDLWQKDAFFSAAEEVQQSADIMESVFRTWIRERREGMEVEDLRELRRELQTALGTAKWQLEEFERAVRLSHGCRPEDSTTTRHRQFIAAIEDQINHVEMALRDSLSEEGNQPLRWVQLDEEERDDLAAFLSGSPGTSQVMKDSCVDLVPSLHSSSMGSQRERKDAYINIDGLSERDTTRQAKNLGDFVTPNKDSNHVVELESRESPKTSEDANYPKERISGQRRTWSSPNFGSWKIVIADKDDPQKTLEESVESSSKGKGLKSSFWRQKVEHLQARGISSYLDYRGINKFTQLFGQIQRQLQGSHHIQFGRSLRIMLFIMLTIFLIGALMCDFKLYDMDRDLINGLLDYKVLG